MHPLFTLNTFAYAICAYLFFEPNLRRMVVCKNPGILANRKMRIEPPYVVGAVHTKGMITPHCGTPVRGTVEAARSSVPASKFLQARTNQHPGLSGVSDGALSAAHFFSASLFLCVPRHDVFSTFSNPGSHTHTLACKEFTIQGTLKNRRDKNSILWYTFIRHRDIMSASPGFPEICRPNRYRFFEFTGIQLVFNVDSEIRILRDPTVPRARQHAQHALCPTRRVDNPLRTVRYTRASCITERTLVPGG